MTVTLIYQGGLYTLLNDESGAAVISSENFSEIIAAVNSGVSLSFGIDAEEFYVRKSMLPKIGLEKVKEILPVEMEGRFVLPAKELFFELTLLKEQEEGDTYLVFALKKQLLIDTLIPLLNKGVRITSVYISNLESFSSLIKDEELSKAKELNFFPKELHRYTEKKLALGVIKKIAIYASAFLLIIVFGLSLRLFFLNKKEAEIKKDIIAQYNIIFSEAKSANLSPNIIQSKLQELKQNYRALKGIELLEILKDISVTTNNLAVKEVNIDNGRMTIKGEGKDYGSVEQYKVALRKNFSTISVTETKNLSDGRMSFVMEATIAY